jgi:hypothetical protein
MSANAQTLAPARPFTSRIVAIVVALGIGAAAGSVITNVVTGDASTPQRTVVGIQPWDQQKLDAMQGRQLATTVFDRAPGIRPWDQGMLDAMEQRQAAVKP